MSEQAKDAGGGLSIKRSQIEQVVAHCRAAQPNEACGLFSTKQGDVVAVFPLRNAEPSPVRYRVDPLDQFKTVRQIEDGGYEFAIFHSHTRTPAYPSPTDVREAREDVPYVIVSLAEDPPSIRAFRIVKVNWEDPHGQIEEVPVDVVG